MVIDLYFCTTKMILINCMSLVYNCTEHHQSHVLYIMAKIIMIVLMALLLLLLLLLVIIIIKKKLKTIAEGESKEVT